MWPWMSEDTFWGLDWCDAGVWGYLLETWLVWLWWVKIPNRELQSSTTCGAIDDRRISLKAIDERVFAKFRDKKCRIYKFAQQKCRIYPFSRQKCRIHTFFVKNLWFHRYVTICLTIASTYTFRSCFVWSIDRTDFLSIDQIFYR